ncbi:hypothetical protein BH09MYX1_BH09MYX1_13010 [soil metagenome]
MRPRLPKSRAKRAALAFAAVLTLAFAVFLFRARPIAAAPPHDRAFAKVTDIASLRLCWAEYARNEAWGQVATAASLMYQNGT